MSFAHAQVGTRKERNIERLGMGQYGLALGVLLHGIRVDGAALISNMQHPLHICRWPRARKESDRGLQAGQGLADDA